MEKTQQQGRSLVEMIAVIVIISLVTVAFYKTFAYVVKSASANALESAINMRVTQLRHQALTKQGIWPETLESALLRAGKDSMGMPIQTYQVDIDTFTLRVGYDQSPMDYNVCQVMMDSPSFDPINKDACQEDMDYADFVFPIKTSLTDTEQQYNSDLNSGTDNNSSSSCGGHGRLSAGNCLCDPGYYLSGKNCLSCSDNYISAGGRVTKCTPCEEGKVSTDHITCGIYCGPHGKYYEDYQGYQGCLCDLGWRDKFELHSEPEAGSNYFYVTVLQKCAVHDTSICGEYGRFQSQVEEGDTTGCWGDDCYYYDFHCTCDPGYYRSNNTSDEKCYDCNSLNRLNPIYSGEDCGACKNGYAEDYDDGECHPACDSSYDCAADEYCFIPGASEKGTCKKITSTSSWTDLAGGEWTNFVTENEFRRYSNQSELARGICEKHGLRLATEADLGSNYTRNNSNGYLIRCKSSVLNSNFPGNMDALLCTNISALGFCVYNSVLCVDENVRLCTSNSNCPSGQFCNMNLDINGNNTKGRCVPIGNKENITYDGVNYIRGEANFMSRDAMINWCKAQNLTLFTQFPFDTSSCTFTDDTEYNVKWYKCTDLGNTPACKAFKGTILLSDSFNGFGRFVDYGDGNVKVYLLTGQEATCDHRGIYAYCR